MVGQAVINIRWVGEAPDEFIGLYRVPQTDGGTITTVTTECVLPVEPILLNMFRRQCYNRVGNISGQRTGVVR